MTDTDATPSEELFTSIAVRLLGAPDVDEGRLFSAQGLRTHGKIFAMLTRGDRITVKLPAARCAELQAAGRGVPFEAGGRRMREWLSLTGPDGAEALGLAEEALAYVRALHGPEEAQARNPCMHRRAFLRLAAGGIAAATTPSLARAAPTARGAPLVLATADDEASVVVLDLATGAERMHVGTLGGPSSIETVGGGATALVGHADLGALSLLDIATLRVRDELGGFGEPRYTAAGPGGRYAYVTDAERGELVVIDLPRAHVAGRLAVGAGARHLTITPDGRSLFVSLGSKAVAVAVVDASDPRRPRLVRTFAPVDRAHDVVVSADGASLWISSGTSEDVAVHDLRTLAPRARLPVGAPPQHVAMAGARVFVTSGADGRMCVYDRAGTLLRTTRIPLDSYNVTSAFGHVVTPSLILGTVTTLDTTGTFVRRERVARASHDACIAPSHV